MLSILPNSVIKLWNERKKCHCACVLYMFSALNTRVRNSDRDSIYDQTPSAPFQSEDARSTYISEFRRSSDSIGFENSFPLRNTLLNTHSTKINYEEYLHISYSNVSFGRLFIILIQHLVSYALKYSMIIIILYGNRNQNINNNKKIQTEQTIPIWNKSWMFLVSNKFCVRMNLYKQMLQKWQMFCAIVFNISSTSILWRGRRVKVAKIDSWNGEQSRGFQGSWVNSIELPNSQFNSSIFDELQTQFKFNLIGNSIQ